MFGFFFLNIWLKVKLRYLYNTLIIVGVQFKPGYVCGLSGSVYCRSIYWKHHPIFSWYSLNAKEVIDIYKKYAEIYLHRVNNCYRKLQHHEVKTTRSDKSQFSKFPPKQKSLKPICVSRKRFRLKTRVLETFPQNIKLLFLHKLLLSSMKNNKKNMADSLHACCMMLFTHVHMKDSGDSGHLCICCVSAGSTPGKH